MIAMEMEGEPLVVPQAEFLIEDPWSVPRACSPVRLRRATDGAAPRLPTSVAAHRDREFLTFVFCGDDAGVVATHLVHDAPLYQEDVVEVFLSPADPTVYYEIEVNPLGTLFDARITSPNGVRAAMRTELEWTCADVFAAVRRTPRTLDVLLRVPFAALGVAAPEAGDVWRGNIFRIDRDRDGGDEYTAWRPTLKTPADFHITAAFGDLTFG